MSTCRFHSARRWSRCKSGQITLWGIGLDYRSFWFALGFMVIHLTICSSVFILFSSIRQKTSSLRWNHSWTFTLFSLSKNCLRTTGILLLWMLCYLSCLLSVECMTCKWSYIAILITPKWKSQPSIRECSAFMQQISCGSLKKDGLGTLPYYAWTKTSSLSFLLLLFLTLSVRTFGRLICTDPGL